MSTLEVDGVTLRYPDNDENALNDVTFTLRGPGIHGVLGRNGAGKSSLLSVAAAFRKPDAGEVRVDGAPIYENQAVTERVCLIRGGGDSVTNNWPEDRIADAFDVAALFRPHWSAAYADELLAKFGLKEFRRKHIGSLSKGQRSQVGAILGLASRAPVTIFDECTAGMDAPARRLFYDEVLRDYAEHPRLVVLASHLIDELAPLLEDVVILHEGRVLLHEQAEVLRGRGATITGPAERVDAATDGLIVLHSQRLGPTARVTVLAHEADRQAAQRAGLMVEPVALQELFVHLTTSEGALR
ncbi:ABC transporter ATP-binding protein [Nocardia puris]|uniref:ATP-binding cassette domain-containing protein n=1 Tax=Nocardia puris TaxID=208602 RepID=UPI0018960700|nr:ABC transporter ATP-binding protein [Nocardia puris]MBF6210613.1 ABC transporter ATP-binding protein [Nocardia puris]MBF6369339.1 ABC transporter ATP-binding protein [Nocardia puris]MBF6457874.1 ABC transporter ATP-binding protein [Nocardia puris]